MIREKTGLLIDPYFSATKIAWLLDNVGLDARFSLVHATHCEPEELDRLGRSGATVVVCPSTEGDLGDGLFGVDAKVVDGRTLVMEVNDNPNVEAGYEDAVLKDALYAAIIEYFLVRFENREATARGS